MIRILLSWVGVTDKTCGQACILIVDVLQGLKDARLRILWRILKHRCDLNLTWDIQTRRLLCLLQGGLEVLLWLLERQLIQFGKTESQWDLCFQRLFHWLVQLRNAQGIELQLALCRREYLVFARHVRLVVFEWLFALTFVINHWMSVRPRLLVTTFHFVFIQINWLLYRLLEELGTAQEAFSLSLVEFFEFAQLHACSVRFLIKNIVFYFGKTVNRLVPSVNCFWVGWSGFESFDQIEVGVGAIAGQSLIL